MSGGEVGDVFVDIGKSGLRLEAATSTGWAERSGAGVSPTVRGDLGLLLGDRIVELLAGPEGRDARRVLIGSTSELTDAERESLLRVVGRAHPAAVIAITDDGSLAHARRLNAPGVLFSIGTGTIAIARTPDGRLSRFDGWGPLAGDRGAAVDVGRRALRAAYRDIDRAADTMLRTAADRRLGGIDLMTARATLADESWPAVLAGLAEDVCTAAAAGDEEAGTLLDDAVAELADTARLAVASAGVPELLVVGRFGTAPAVSERLAPALAACGIRLVDALPPDAVGAREILAGPYALALHIATPAPGARP